MSFAINEKILFVLVALNHLLFGRFFATFVYWVRFRKNPNIDMKKSLGSSDVDVEHFKTTYFLAVTYLAWLTFLMLTWFYPQFDESIFGRPLVVLPSIVGWVVCLTSFVGMTISQIMMGEAFRIGQEPTSGQTQNSLKSNLILKYSRNPIYMFSFLYIFGVTLWSMTLVCSVLCLMFGFGIHRLVLSEEKFLLEKFGDNYRRYCDNTPRYLFRFPKEVLKQ